MPVGRHDRRVAALDHRPRKRLHVRAVSAQQARSVDLQPPAALGQRRRERGFSKKRFRSFWMGNDRNEAETLDVLGQCDEGCDRAEKGNLREDMPRARQDIPTRIFSQQDIGRRQFVSEPQIEAGTLPDLLERRANFLLALPCQRQMRPNVRRREQDRGPVACRAATQRNAVVHRLRPVVARGNDVTVTIDERKSLHLLSLTSRSANKEVTKSPV